MPPTIFGFTLARGGVLWRFPLSDCPSAIAGLPADWSDSFIGSELARRFGRRCGQAEGNANRQPAHQREQNHSSGPIDGVALVGSGHSKDPLHAAERRASPFPTSGRHRPLGALRLFSIAISALA